eukprot:8854001-Alexandrium_andersonii.AAC.1
MSACTGPRWRRRRASCAEASTRVIAWGARSGAISTLRRTSGGTSRTRQDCGTAAQPSRR